MPVVTQRAGLSRPPATKVDGPEGANPRGRQNQPLSAKGDNVEQGTSIAVPSQDANAAALALVAAIRDQVYLEQWALDELLDMQPSNEHAKALLCALAACGIIPDDECEIAMIGRELSSV